MTAQNPHNPDWQVGYDYVKRQRDYQFYLTVQQQIRMGNSLAKHTGFFAEGGAKNIGRRDGMGIVVLAAIETIGELPHHYFQAVGSGTGAIAAWEAAQRLMADERFSSCNMTLHLSQNLPFTPMFDAWKQNSRTLLNVEESIQKTMLRTIRAQVLSNRQPPYSIIGGVFDILQDSRGYFYAVTNKEAIRAGKLFLAKEGCDLDPAAEITLASLIQAIEMGRVDKKALVLLNITGGGYSCLQQDKHIDYLKPDINLAPENWQVPQLADDLIQRLQSE